MIRAPDRPAPVHPGFTYLGYGIALLRARHWIVRSALVGGALLGASTLASPRTWTATTQLAPQTRGQSAIGSLAAQYGVLVGGGGGAPGPDYYAQLMRSGDVLAPILRDTFTIHAAGTSARGTLLDLLQLDAGDDAVRTELGLAWLRGALRTATDPIAGTLRAQLTTPWPAVSAEVLRRIVRGTEAVHREAQRAASSSERAFGEARVATADSALRAAESRLLAFSRANRAPAAAARSTLERERLERDVSLWQQRLTSLTTFLDRARIEEELETPKLAVLEQASEPARPDPRRLPLQVLLGMVLGTAAVAIGVLVRGLLRDALEDQPPLADAVRVEAAELRAAIRRPWSLLGPARTS